MNWDEAFPQSLCTCCPDGQHPRESGRRVRPYRVRADGEIAVEEFTLEPERGAEYVVMLDGAVRQNGLWTGGVGTCNVPGAGNGWFHHNEHEARARATLGELGWGEGYHGDLEHAFRVSDPFSHIMLTLAGQIRQPGEVLSHVRNAPYFRSALDGTWSTDQDHIRFDRVVSQIHLELHAAPGVRIQVVVTHDLLVDAGRCSWTRDVMVSAISTRTVESDGDWFLATPCRDLHEDGLDGIAWAACRYRDRWSGSARFDAARGRYIVRDVGQVITSTLELDELGFDDEEFQLLSPPAQPKPARLPGFPGGC